MTSSTPPLPELDDAEGPARRLPAHSLRALRVRIVARASAVRSLRVPEPLRPLRVAAAALVAFAAVGSAAAAVRSFPALREYWQAPAAVSEPPRPTAVRPRRQTPERTADTELPVVQPAEPAPQPGAPAEPASRGFTDLLERANQLRAERRWRAAEALYARAVEQQAGLGPRSAAALAAAELRLAQLGRPRSALAMFERVLRLQPNGPLAEQARHGRAQALRALGDDAGEARALQAFVAAHPHSLMRPSAEERLRALRE